MMVMLLIPVGMVSTAESLADQLSPESEGSTFTVPVGQGETVQYRGALPVITDATRLAAVRSAISHMPGCLIREVTDPVDGETAWPLWLGELGLQVIWPPR